jgi:DNA-binding MarR family transcriptional regulator
VTEGTDSGGHSAVCLRLMRVFPRVMRGMRRYQDQTTPQTPAPLGPRHVAALEQLRDGPLSVGTLADRLGLTLSTVSGVLAGLDLAGFVERSADRADRRRTIVQIAPGAAPVVREWLYGAAAPLARVLDKLGADERAAFIKAMDMLEAEFRASEGGQEPCPGGLDHSATGRELGADGLPRAATPPANPG